MIIKEKCESETSHNNSKFLNRNFLMNNKNNKYLPKFIFKFKLVSY